MKTTKDDLALDMTPENRTELQKLVKISLLSQHPRNKKKAQMKTTYLVNKENATKSAVINNNWKTKIQETNTYLVTHCWCMH